MFETKIRLLFVLLFTLFHLTNSKAEDAVCTIDDCYGMAQGLRSDISQQIGSSTYGFEHSIVAEITDEILQVAGLRPNFQLIRTQEVDNAAAVNVDREGGGKVRVLAYNPDFFDDYIGNRKWWVYAIMAHEIGHHMQGHTLELGGSKPLTELEADEYAGFILAGLGATAEQAIEMWGSLGEAGSLTHPPRKDRILAVTTGWQKWDKLHGSNAGRTSAGGNSGQDDSRIADFILPQSSTRKLTSGELSHLTPQQLRIARNEIFARGGYKFKSADLRAYFSKKPWYSPGNRAVELNSVERYNVKLIKNLEDNPVSGFSGGFVFPHSSKQYLTGDDVRSLTKAMRRIARNEIFARHGYMFNSRDLQQYFGKMAWYSAITPSVNLNKIEWANVRLIRSYE